MSVVISPESELGKELEKWNKPYRYVEFPKLLYKAHDLRGKGAVGDPHDETFEARCTRIVRSASEQAAAEAEGWRVGAQAALELYEADQQAIADEAANVAFHVARMSEKAQAEYAEASDTTHSHVTDVSGPRTAGGRFTKKTRAFSGKEEVDGNT
jgi:hypothetical protein